MKEVEFSLGWELEAIKGASVVPDMVEVGSDGSVGGDGLEYRLKERAVDNPSEAIEALKVLVFNSSLQTNKSCGFHVHMGLKNTGKLPANIPGVWAAWCVNLGKLVEDDAFKAVPDTRSGNQYCKRWNGVYMPLGLIKQRYERNKGSNHSRYQWINVVEMFREQGIRTVEIRLMGESKRFTYLLAWASFCLLLGQAAYRLINDPSLIDQEALQLRRYLQRISSDIKSGTYVSAVALSKEMANDAKLHKESFSRFPEFAENEFYLKQELQSELQDWSRFHAPKWNEETDSYAVPRSPVRYCHCEKCESVRSKRAAF